MRRSLIFTAAAFFALGAAAGAFAQPGPPIAQDRDRQAPRDAYGNQRDAAPPPVDPALPSRLNIRPGTYVTVRINQWLSSDRNQQGDAFFASLATPLVVDGVVVAQRGQTVAG